MKQHNKPRKSHALFSLGFLEMIPSPRLGFFRGVFLANQLASTDNLTKQPKDMTHSNEDYRHIKRGHNKQQYNKTC